MLDSNIRCVLVIFLVVVMVNLTPSFAVQMEQVANDAKEYEDESHEKKGFFGKIKFMAKGFALIDEAKSAEKDSKKDDVQENANLSDASNYESMWNENKLPQQQLQRLLNFKNTKKTEIATKNGNETNNDTINNITSNTTANIPEECLNDAKNIMAQLTAMNFTITQTTEPAVSNMLTGRIVQIIDDKGFIRYLYVKKMDKDKLILLTNDKKEITMKIDEFKKSFTGVVLVIGNLGNPKSIMTKINELQKNKIQTDIENVQKLKNEAKTNTIIGTILAGVGVVLLILAVLIAIIYSKVVATPVANNAANTVTIEGQRFTVLATDDFYKDLTASFTRPSITQDKLIYGTQNSIKMLADYGAATPDIIATLATMGIILTPLVIGELATNIGSNNWVSVVLGIVGLILLIFGMALIIAGLIVGIKNICGWLRYKTILEGLKYEDEDMDSWLNRTDQDIGIKTNNQSLNFNTAPLFNGTGLIS